MITAAESTILSTPDELTVTLIMEQVVDGLGLSCQTPSVL